MLVLSRAVGESLMIRYPESTYQLTVLQLFSPQYRVLMSITAAATLTDSLQTVIELQLGEPHRLSDDFAITLIDLRALKARLGREASREATVHRWEADEAIRRKIM